MTTNACAVWDFRANQDLLTLSEINKFMKDNCKKWAFQLEKSDTGYVHWQGRFSLIKKRLKKPLMSMFPVDKVPHYLEPTVKENHQEEFFYAMKKDTRVEGPYTDKDNEKVYIPSQYLLLHDKLYDWQKFLLECPVDERKIICVYDPVGNHGKSTLSAIAELYYNGIDLPPISDYKELVAVACNIVQSQGDYDKPRTFLLDMPRSLPKKDLQGMYAAIEQMKKGKLFDMRYKYKSVWIETPKIIVFTNVLPDVDLLSHDRWQFYKLDNVGTSVIMSPLRYISDIGKWAFVK